MFLMTNVPSAPVRANRLVPAIFSLEDAALLGLQGAGQLEKEDPQEKDPKDSDFFGHALLRGERISRQREEQESRHFNIRTTKAVRLYHPSAGPAQFGRQERADPW
jgi:hypothetical protein